MDILCLMGLFPREYESEIIKNSIRGTQYAANKLQWAIVKGLVEQENVNLHMINSLYIGSFPRKYRKMLVPSFPFFVDGKECGYNVGFWNLPVIKAFSRYCGIKRKITAWAKSNSGEEKVVVAYAMTTPMVEILYYIKRKFPEIKSILVVPDLPEYMSFSKSSLLRTFIKKHHIAHIRKKLFPIDGYVLLTDYMKDWFERPIKYTVIEGINGTPSESKENIVREKIILYSGGCCEEYGVLDLVEAFERIEEPEWRLEIIGDGELIPILKEKANTDGRILLTGLLPNDEVVNKQKRASILVNPRQGNQDFTKYSFPSKTIEYMASGTLMVGYRLLGIPDEYFEYIVEIPSEPQGLENCLKRLIRLSEESREEMGAKAKEFIQNKKNAKVQCNKIIQLIKNLEE